MMQNLTRKDKNDYNVQYTIFKIEFWYKIKKQNDKVLKKSIQKQNKSIEYYSSFYFPNNTVHFLKIICAINVN